MGRIREKRMAIARDVLAQLKQQRYIARNGTYLKIDSLSKADVEDKDLSIQTLFKEKPVTCEVCALGACFMSLVNLENDFTRKEMMCETDYYNKDVQILSIYQDTAIKHLSKYFPGHMLALIESAFECTFITNDNDHKYKSYDIYHNDYKEYPSWIYDPAIQWGEQYTEDTDRLRAIMLNIIRNEGDFIVPKKFVAKYGRKVMYV